MCYAVYLSTDSTADLSVHTTDLVRLERLNGERQDPVVGLLMFTNRWYIGSKSGCSCTFRHLVSTELGFGEPEEWYPEDQDALQATKHLYEVIAILLSAGHAVDCLDRWEGTEPKDIHTLAVCLHEVSREAFRLFENHRFTFTTGKGQPGRGA